eukprot:762701-Hanusia_phi.AAC.6
MFLNFRRKSVACYNSEKTDNQQVREPQLKHGTARRSSAVPTGTRFEVAKQEPPEAKVAEAARKNRYGCPSRLKQLMCLAKSVKFIRSEKKIFDSSGKVLNVGTGAQEESLIDEQQG